jgi:hypothetical protein
LFKNSIFGIFEPGIPGNASRGLQKCIHNGGLQVGFGYKNTVFCLQYIAYMAFVHKIHFHSLSATIMSLQVLSMVVLFFFFPPWKGTIIIGVDCIVGMMRLAQQEGKGIKRCGRGAEEIAKVCFFFFFFFFRISRFYRPSSFIFGPAENKKLKIWRSFPADSATTSNLSISISPSLLSLSHTHTAILLSFLTKKATKQNKK